MGDFGDGLLGAITGAAQAGSSIVAADMGNSYDRASQQRTQAYNASEAQKARDFNSAEANVERGWQQNMSNSAYQRSRADMEKAGLNPIMMVNQGGASTPSGAQASGPAASSANQSPARTLPIGEALERTISGARDQERFSKEMRQRDVDIAKTGADGVQSSMMTKLLAERRIQTARDNIYQTAESDREARLAANKLSTMRDEVDASLVKPDALIERATRVIGGVTSARRGAKSGMTQRSMSDDEFDAMSRRQYERKHK